MIRLEHARWNNLGGDGVVYLGGVDHLKVGGAFNQLHIQGGFEGDGTANADELTQHRREFTIGSAEIGDRATIGRVSQAVERSRAALDARSAQRANGGVNDDFLFLDPRLNLVPFADQRFLAIRRLNLRFLQSQELSFRFRAKFQC